MLANVRPSLHGITLWMLFFASWLGGLNASSTASAQDRLVYVTWDGFRWQELFGGADESLLNKDVGGVPEVAVTRESFWRETPEARRATLLPFVWEVIAQQGQIVGDPARDSKAVSTNGLKFSYPGYSEMFVGFVNKDVVSNNKIPNPHVTVLEHLHRQPGFGGNVAAFATWDVIEFVLNRERSGMLVLTGWQAVRDEPLTPGQQKVNELVRDLPRNWRGNVYDVVSYQAAREHLQRHKPRVLYLGLGETDEWAHARRYDLYLEAAQRSDRYLRELWELLQSMPEYRGRTTLIVATDHGRGVGRDWANHGEKIVGAEQIWMLGLGPKIPALGVRERVHATQSQIAATLAEAVGVDFRAAYPDAAPAFSWK